MIKKVGIIALLIWSILLSVALVLAQQPSPASPQAAQPRTPPPNADPLGDVLFPPDLIMRHGRELGLTDDQKSFMRGEIQKTTTRFNELQWQLQDAMEALSEIMKSSSVNEQQALAQLDKVLDAEREIKRLHIGMAIRIKNQLTTEQQAKLRSIKATSWQAAQPWPNQ
jgi:Spy/CpxP family protein refolding chaperone